MIKNEYMMKIVLTGSLGHISKPLALDLIAKGHLVTIISSNASKQKNIEALGAKPAIGSLENVDFLTSTFIGADIVYLMEPPINFFDPNLNVEDFWISIAQAYKQAILNTGITKVIHLSSIGGHTSDGVGMLIAHHHCENILKELPETVHMKFIRPVGFYYNMFAFIPAIKNANAIFQNYGGDEKEPWVSPLDIAVAILEEIEKPFGDSIVRYIASDEVAPNEVAQVLGNVIGKPDLKWIIISDEDFYNNLIKIGFNPLAAKGLTDMNIGRRNHLYDDYNKNKPELGKVKLRDFARDFEKIYNQ
jgi:uncharacterized protein YbjT (DUF2867 family)